MTSYHPCQPNTQWDLIGRVPPIAGHTLHVCGPDGSLLLWLGAQPPNPTFCASPNLLIQTYDLNCGHYDAIAVPVSNRYGHISSLRTRTCSINNLRDQWECDVDVIVQGGACAVTSEYVTPEVHVLYLHIRSGGRGCTLLNHSVVTLDTRFGTLQKLFCPAFCSFEKNCGVMQMFTFGGLEHLTGEVCKLFQFFHVDTSNTGEEDADYKNCVISSRCDEFGPPDAFKASMCCSLDGTTLFLYGGYLRGVFHDVLWEYNVMLHLWTRQTVNAYMRRPPPLSRSQLVRYDRGGESYLLLAGGMTVGNIRTQEVWVYNIRTGVWHGGSDQEDEYYVPPDMEEDVKRPPPCSAHQIVFSPQRMSLYWLGGTDNHHGVQGENIGTLHECVLHPVTLKELIARHLGM
eukprot:PhF_6_TR6281/c0_g1_i2/m.9512